MNYDFGIAYIKSNQFAVKVTMSSFRSQNYIHIREYIFDPDEEIWFPTKKGYAMTAEEVDSFVKESDSSNGSHESYDKLVDRILQNPHYGERMAIGWLDVVRYADTIGYHSDNPRNVWPYRDWVVSAFNRNLPFDQFVREQLAGDLLPGSTVNQRVGSGFNRLHRISGEGGIQDSG